jgi:ligand-binding sensor domain-containing protein
MKKSKPLGSIKVGLGKIAPDNKVIEDLALRGTAIYSINIGPNDYLWLGSESQGLLVLDVNTNKIIQIYDLPMAAYILLISSQQLWVATVGGFFMINPENNEVRKFVH